MLGKGMPIRRNVPEWEAFGDGTSSKSKQPRGGVSSGWDVQRAEASAMSLKAWHHNASFKNSEARTRSRPGFFAHFRPDLREQVDAAQLQKEVASVVVRCFQPTLCQDGDELRHRVQIDSTVQARMVRTAVAILHATYPTKFGSAAGTSHMAACIRPFGRRCTSWTPPVQCFHECLFDSLSCLTLPALIRKYF